MGRFLTFLSLYLLAVVGCNHGPERKNRTAHDPIEVKEVYSGPYPIKVVCTTGMVADLVRHVGGPQVQVDQLMGPDVDPHLFKASHGDVKRLAAADLIFYSGLHLEGKMGFILERSRRKPTFAIADGIDDKKYLGGTGGAHDPHLWFDVSLWCQGVGLACDVLRAFDPSHASEYKARADAYQAELSRLHDEVKQQIAAIPRDRRVLVTAHDAFHYFGRAYDIEVKAIQGISTEAEASIKDVNDLVDFISRRRIKAAFVETSVNQRTMQAVIEGCQAQGHTVVLGGTLYSDAMGPENSPAGTYPGMIRHNVQTIVGALK